MSLRLAILASGRGSNLRAILDAQERGALPTSVVGVFSDKPVSSAIALAIARCMPAVAAPARYHAMHEGCE